LRIAGDATADLRELEPWLQEEVLDEVEKLLQSAPAGLRLDSMGVAVHDFERDILGQRYVVFMRVHVDRQKSLLTVLGIKQWAGTPPAG